MNILIGRGVWWLAPLPFLLLLLALGTNPLVAFLAGVAWALAVTPYVLLGRNLYTIIPVVFAARYVGFAIVAKCLYLQPLDENLHHPITAYALSAVLMGVVALVCSLAQRLDRGGSVVPIILDFAKLRRIGALAFGFGAAAVVVLAMGQTRRLGLAAGGAANVVSAAMSQLVMLGIIAETTHAILTKRSFLSGRLVLYVAVTLVLALFLNVRSVFANAVVACGLAVFMLGALRWRTVLVGAAAAAVVWSVLSPVSLALRDAKEGRTVGEFAGMAVEKLAMVVTDPGYFDYLQKRQKLQAMQAEGLVAYDYFGDRANTANRLSYVGLVDAVYNGTETHDLVGTDGFAEVYERVMPSFMTDKRPRPYAHGDWLSWRMGMSEMGRIYFANFALPQEGLASFGTLGFVLMPFAFYLSGLVLLGRMSTLLKPYANSIFLVAVSLPSFVEGTSDALLAEWTREYPILLGAMLALSWMAGHSREQRGRSASRAASASVLS